MKLGFQTQFHLVQTIPFNAKEALLMEVIFKTMTQIDVQIPEREDCIRASEEVSACLTKFNSYLCLRGILLSSANSRFCLRAVT